MRPALLALLASDGQPAATVELVAYDGSTRIKRDGSRKVMRFSSGKLGFYAGGKVFIDGKTYQASCSFVELGPKTATPVVSFTPEQIAEMNAQRQATQDDGEHTDSE